jgi:Ran GTPase-activating protein (RanGAP) involved in mRNA processing and transport
MKPHNYSVTTLNMGFNEISDHGVEALTTMIKNNMVLRKLTLDLCPKLRPAHYKAITTAIRLYNTALEELSFADNPISVKAIENISRVFDSKETRVERLNLSNCTLKHQHINAFSTYILTAQYLTHLDLSGNPLGDKACTSLAEIIGGQVDKLTSRHLPPFKALDFSSCGLKPEGCAKLLQAVATRRELVKLDLTSNVIGPDNDVALSALARCSLQEMRLASCGLGTKGASTLFASLARADTSIAQHLRFCYLSGNEISDSCTEVLCDVLTKNMTLEALDLGFNLFTDRNKEIFKVALRVMSSSAEIRKVSDLSVNMVGNKCDPYMLETPGLSRAKSNFLFGVRPNEADPSNHGYNHISHASRGHFMARKELDNHYRQYMPLNPLNSLV